jgi:hypothetical protein
MSDLLVWPIVLSVAAAASALVVLIRGTRGCTLLAGILGTLLLVLSLVNSLLSRWFLSLLPEGASDDELFVILAARIAINGVLIGAGLIFFTYAILTADRWPRS